MNSEVVIGYGKVWISHIMVLPDERHGILLRPVEKAHPIDSKDPNWNPNTPYQAQDGDVVIWLDNLEGARVLQETVNVACLELNGYSVSHKHRIGDPIYKPDPPEEP
jgi:hypothetical protein